MNNESLKIIKSEKNITKISKVENTIYFQELTKGVFMIENGISKLISDHPILKDNKIVEIFLKEGKLCFLTQKEGFYFFDKQELKKWDISSNEILSNKTIYSAIQLQDESFVLGTISNGIIHL